MTLDDYWFERPDVEMFAKALEKLGFEWEIVDLEDNPTMRIWKPTSEEYDYERVESFQE